MICDERRTARHRAQTRKSYWCISMSVTARMRGRHMRPEGHPPLQLVLHIYDRVTLSSMKRKIWLVIKIMQSKKDSQPEFPRPLFPYRCLLQGPPTSAIKAKRYLVLITQYLYGDDQLLFSLSVKLLPQIILMLGAIRPASEYISPGRFKRLGQKTLAK